MYAYEGRLTPELSAEWNRLADELVAEQEEQKRKEQEQASEKKVTPAKTRGSSKRGRKHTDAEMAELLKQWNETGVMPEQWRHSKQMKTYIKKRYPKTYAAKLEKLAE